MGAIAEEAAATYLVRSGHEVIERNWKTKYCEIDIVSHKDGIVYFTEVKYRKNETRGDGLAAITAKKLNQMRFAARMYAQTKRLRDTDMRLVAIAMSGDPATVDSMVVID